MKKEMKTILKDEIETSDILPQLEEETKNVLEQHKQLYTEIMNNTDSIEILDKRIYDLDMKCIAFSRRSKSVKKKLESAYMRYIILVIILFIMLGMVGYASTR
ncbi:hypothetical protein TCON_1159 [Astathelohania contejeani]|uniref:t-SNARE coiled-coil homology domain-containing protein n=1 Tax=Astathelohania contejeani TaxID=164912 RepID=A0ABQ7HZS5_9MICR|nr:hypothetical protein TCON_1159 [Thelohania contejeani]